MKARKIINGKDKDRILIEFNGSWITAATPILSTKYWLGNNDWTASVEIDLLQERWVHPHLPKKIKEQVKKELNVQI